MPLNLCLGCTKHLMCFFFIHSRNQSCNTSYYAHACDAFILGNFSMWNDYKRIINNSLSAAPHKLNLQKCPRHQFSSVTFSDFGCWNPPTCALMTDVRKATSSVEIMWFRGHGPVWT